MSIEKEITKAAAGMKRQLNAAAFLVNSEFKKNALALQQAAKQGLISLDRLESTPEKVQRTAKNSFTGSTPLGVGANTNKEFTVDPQLKKFVPNVINGTTDQEARGENFSGSIQLTPGVALGIFLGGKTGGTNPNNIAPERHGEILKYLYLQAEILSAARSRPEFNGFMITVDEGIYDFDDVETTTEDTLAAISVIGRAIAYTCKDKSGGKTDVEKTFALAEYFSTLPWYDKILLDYYNFGAGEDDALGMRVYVILPELNDEYNGTFGRKKETVFNGKTQSQSLLLLD